MESCVELKKEIASLRKTITDRDKRIAGLLSAIDEVRAAVVALVPNFPF